jgi:hypothetical protein
VDLDRGALEEPLDELVHRVGAELLGEVRGADDVAKQHGEELALPGERALGERRRDGGRGRRDPITRPSDGGAAGRAHLYLIGHLGAALWTRHAL